MTVPVRRIGYWREPSYYARHQRLMTTNIAYSTAFVARRIRRDITTALSPYADAVWRIVEAFRPAPVYRRTMLCAPAVHRGLR